MATTDDGGGHTDGEGDDGAKHADLDDDDHECGHDADAAGDDNDDGPAQNSHIQPLTALHFPASTRFPSPPGS
eukprot:5231834-Pyramimonas_sp.AAC.1